MVEWRPVVGYEGRYQVSNEGQVMSLITGRILRDCRLNKGYRGVCLYAAVQSGGRTQKKSHLLHRIVATAFLGPSDLQVNHIDLDKTNNRLSNLEYLTGRDNIRHAINSGAPVGQRLRRHNKLTDADARTIRRLVAEGSHTQAELAQRFGVSGPTISLIVSGKRRAAACDDSRDHRGLSLELKSAASMPDPGIAPGSPACKAGVVLLDQSGETLHSLATSSL